MSPYPLLPTTTLSLRASCPLSLPFHFSAPSFSLIPSAFSSSCISDSRVRYKAKHVARLSTGKEVEQVLKERNEEEEGHKKPRRQAWDKAVIDSDEQSYGEVSKILSSLAKDGKMFYQIEWKDGHEPSWLPASNIAKDILAEYEGPWWKAARSADGAKLKELLEDEGRDIDAVDENGRTALLFTAGIGSEKCVRLLIEAGANVDCQDFDGFSPLHIAAGYIKPNIVSALLEYGANADLQDLKGRTALTLVEELLERAPKANPLQFARRLSLENIAKILEEASFETAVVEQILEKRSRVDGGIEYLVKWKDGFGEEWLPVDDIAEDLVQDYEAGLEYAVAEKILDKREEKGQVEYLVKWADIEKATWEPSDNVTAELVDEFENTGGERHRMKN